MFFKLTIKAALISLLFLFAGHLFDISIAQAQAEPDPETLGGNHCIGLGGLDDDLETPDILDINAPDFCGCTWGNIYYRGQVLHNVDVSLSFTDKITVGTTHVPTGTGVIEPPFYSVTGIELGASRYDVMALKVEFDGTEIARSFRALPEDGEQHISFALPEYGAWVTPASGKYNNALAVHGDILYAGGDDGLIATDLTTGEIDEFRLPWPTGLVGRTALGPSGELWASSDANRLGKFDGESWTPINDMPYEGIIRALQVDPESGTLWVGIGNNDDNSGLVATYDGETWETVHTVNAQVTTLTLDANGNPWIGTWGSGVYHQNAAGTWTNYSVPDGLASRYIVAAAASGEYIWFGADPAGSSNSVHLGGVSMVDINSQSWSTYTRENGLPADGTYTKSPARIKSIGVDTDGKAWVLAANGLYWFQPQFNAWIMHTTDLSADRLAVDNSNIFIADADEVLRFDRSSLEIQGTAPTVDFTTPSGQIFDQSTNVLIEATATDLDDSVERPIVAWEWQSSIDGPLCTTADLCTLPANVLTAGAHTVSLRVQDDEGEWSQSITTDFTIEPSTSQPLFRVFLPTIR